MSGLPLFDWKPQSPLQAALVGRGWVTARELETELEINERAIRAEAEAAKGQVVTGNKGYCLITECTADEARHAANRLMSQARKMAERANLIFQKITSSPQN